MTRTLDAYAIRLAALKACDITGVRPRELHRYRAYGEVPDGLSEESRAARTEDRGRGEGPAAALGGIVSKA
ncbi:hypothetical protein ACU686_08810 [Yinghuangia aomiensis]